MKLVRTDPGGDTVVDYGATVPGVHENWVSHPGSNGKNYRQSLGKLNLTTPSAGVKTGYSPGWVNGHIEYVDMGIPVTVELTGETYVMGFTPNGTTVPQDRIIEMQQEAVTTFLSRVYEAQRGMFAGGVFLAELTETIRMVKRPYMSFCKITRNFWLEYSKLIYWYRRQMLLHNGLPGFTKQLENTVLREVNKLYLEWTYGVKPLAGDMDDLIKSIQKLSEKAKNKKVKAKVTEKVTGSSVYPLMHMDGFRIYSYADVVSEATVTCSGMVNLESVAWSDGPMSLGFRPRDFVPAIWEGIPWSFIVDYWSNVGDYIQSQQVCQSGIIWDKCTTRIVTNTTVYTVGGAYTSGQIKQFRFASSPSTFNRISHSRSVVNDSYSSISWNLPTAKQVVNMASLLATFVDVHSS